MAEVLKCDRDGCEETTGGPRAEASWFVLERHGGELDFCSWECLGMYADAKVNAEQVRKSESDRRDKPGRRG